MQKKVTVDAKTEVVVPKSLLSVLADIGWPTRVEDMLEWLTENRDQRAEFVAAAKKLDVNGLKSLRHFIKHNLNLANGKDPLYGAKRSFEIQQYKQRVKMLLEKVSTGHLTFTLANGLTCSDIHPLIHPAKTTSYYVLIRTPYKVLIRCENSQVQLTVDVRNLLRLYENATKNASELKRLRPWRIDCEVDGENRHVPDDRIPGILRALVDKIPPPIATLMA
jgi:hypothetical protein